MNCTDLRPLLPGAIYGDLTETEAAQVAEHLTGCSSCRLEHAALQRVSQQLNALTTPSVQIDFPHLYQEAARVQRRPQRRWWVAGAGLAAAVLIGLALLKLEVCAEGHQLVIRWGAPPSAPVDLTPTPAPNPPVVLAANPESEERLKFIADYLNALARDAENREKSLKAELSRLQARQNQLQAQSAQSAERMAATERDVAVLYNVQFNPTTKGASE